MALHAAKSAAGWFHADIAQSLLSPCKQPPQNIIPIVYQRRLSREKVQHSIQINRKRGKAHKSQPQLRTLRMDSPNIPVSKKTGQKQYPKRCRRIELHAPRKTTCQNVKYSARHSAACAWKTCQDQLRAECVKHTSYDYIIKKQCHNRCTKVFDISPYSF